jgi:hypothetical protein
MGKGKIRENFCERKTGQSTKRRGGMGSDSFSAGGLVPGSGSGRVNPGGDTEPSPDEEWTRRKPDVLMGIDFPEDALHTAQGVPIWRYSRTAGDPHKNRLRLAGFVNWEMWRWGNNGIR